MSDHLLHKISMYIVMGQKGDIVCDALLPGASPLAGNPNNPAQPRKARQLLAEHTSKQIARPSPNTGPGWWRTNISCAQTKLIPTAPPALRAGSGTHRASWHTALAQGYGTEGYPLRLLAEHTWRAGRRHIRVPEKISLLAERT